MGLWLPRRAHQPRLLRFVSRITFYLQIVTARSYTFFLGSDDSSK